MTAGEENASCAFRYNFAAAGNLRFAIWVPIVQRFLDGQEIPPQLGSDRARALPARSAVD